MEGAEHRNQRDIFRCSAPLRMQAAFFYKYYRDSVAFQFCDIVGGDKNKVLKNREIIT